MTHCTWRHNGHDSVSNHQPRDCFLSRSVHLDTDQRKHQSSASLAFVWGIHRGPVNSPHKWPVTRKMFPFDDVIMIYIDSDMELLAMALNSALSNSSAIVVIWAPSQYPKRRLFVRSRKVSKPWDWYYKLSYRFEIWQAHRQHCCRSACHISERSDNSKYKSSGFETLRDLTERRLSFRILRRGPGRSYKTHNFTDSLNL